MSFVRNSSQDTQMLTGLCEPRVPAPCTDQQACSVFLTMSRNNSCHSPGQPQPEGCFTQERPRAHPSRATQRQLWGGERPQSRAPSCSCPARSRTVAPRVRPGPRARARLYPPTSRDTRTARSQRGCLSCKDTRRRVFTRKQNRKKTLGRTLKPDSTQETRFAGQRGVWAA